MNYIYETLLVNDEEVDALIDSGSSLICIHSSCVDPNIQYDREILLQGAFSNETAKLAYIKISLPKNPRNSLIVLAAVSDKINQQLIIPPNVLLNLYTCQGQNFDSHAFEDETDVIQIRSTVSHADSHTLQESDEFASSDDNKETYDSVTPIGADNLFRELTLVPEQQETNNRFDCNIININEVELTHLTNFSPGGNKINNKFLPAE